jgi:hypothetical protein
MQRKHDSYANEDGTAVNKIWPVNARKGPEWRHNIRLRHMKRLRGDKSRWHIEGQMARLLAAIVLLLGLASGHPVWQVFALHRGRTI